MPNTLRRVAVAATLALALAACTNPVAPAPGNSADAPAERPSAGVYLGGMG